MKRHIVKNPIDAVSLEYKKESTRMKTKDKFLENDDYHAIIDFALNHNKLFKRLYYTGRRAREALALQQSAIELFNNAAHINGTLQYRGKKLQTIYLKLQPG